MSVNPFFFCLFWLPFSNPIFCFSSDAKCHFSAVAVCRQVYFYMYPDQRVMFTLTLWSL